MYKTMQNKSIIYFIYGLKRDEETGDGWSLHNDMVHDLHSSECFANIKINILDEACSTYEGHVRCI